MIIHNIFHVLLLELCQNIPEDAQPLQIEIKAEKEHYKIKEILDSRTYYGKLQYLIK